MNTAELIVEKVEKFYNKLENDEHARFRSWEYCYDVFCKARNVPSVDYDYLSLQLAFYLASWGMYRGSSFLLQKDYRVHVDTVKTMLDKKYDILVGANFDVLLQKENLELLNELYTKLKERYDDVRRSVKCKDIKQDVSSTLITKILMGTMGCVPAYDQYFVSGVRAEKVASGAYGTKSLKQLAEFYKINEPCFEKTRNKLKVGETVYPQMKLLDMGFWEIGVVVEEEKKLAKQANKETS